MRKYKTFLTIIALLIPVLLLSACGKSEFGLTESTEKHMLITAKMRAGTVLLRPVPLWSMRVRRLSLPPI